jgi:DNA-binding transcriptional LysR family regulator
MAPSRIRRYLRHGRLSQLAVFEASARHGCYTRAARELHLAQPTVSTQIRKLTDALGVPLFEQVGKRMRPTEAGLRLQSACREILSTLARLEDELSSLRALDAGRLSLAAGSSAGRLASRLLASFAREHPALDVSLRVHNRQALLERMQSDGDDLYLFANPPREGVVSQQILPHSLVVVASPGHRLARGGAVPFEALAIEPFVLREKGSGAREVVEAQFRGRAIEPRVRLELPSDEAIEEAVRAGLGLAVLPEDASRAERGLVTLPVEGFPLAGFLYLCYPVGKALSPAGRAFLEFARRTSRSRQ